MTSAATTGALDQVTPPARQAKEANAAEASTASHMIRCSSNQEFPIPTPVVEERATDVASRKTTAQPRCASRKAGASLARIAALGVGSFTAMDCAHARGLQHAKMSKKRKRAGKPALFAQP